MGNSINAGCGFHSYKTTKFTETAAKPKSRILKTVKKDGRIWELHANKGWRSRKEKPTK